MRSWGAPTLLECALLLGLTALQTSVGGFCRLPDMLLDVQFQLYHRLLLCAFACLVVEPLPNPLLAAGRGLFKAWASSRQGHKAMEHSKGAEIQQKHRNGMLPAYCCIRSCFACPASTTAPHSDTFNIQTRDLIEMLMPATAMRRCSSRDRRLQDRAFKGVSTVDREDKEQLL